MAQRNSVWLWVHILLIAGCLLAALFQMKGFAAQSEFVKPSWSFPFVIAGFCIFGVVVCFWIQTMNPRAPDKWEKPSLYSSPLTFSQPLQKFYTGALCMMASGLGFMIFGIFNAPVRWAWELPLPAGIGAWLGVRLCIWGFQERFGSNSET